MIKWSPNACLIGREAENPYTGKMVDNEDTFGYPTALASNSTVIADHFIKKAIIPSYENKELELRIEALRSEE